MNLSKRALALAVATVVAAPAYAGDSPLTANIGAVSNYMWRGLTQTKDGAAVQGGVDYAHESGFSLGTWVSNVDWGTDDPSYEIDFYGGYAGKAGDFGYNITTTYYAYPDADNVDFWELGVSGNWSFLTVGLAYTLDGEAPSGSAYRKGDLYYYGSISYELPIGITLGATLGHTNFDDLGSEGDYTNWQISISKSAGDYGTFSLNYDQNDGGDSDVVAVDDDPKFWVGWKKTF